MSTPAVAATSTGRRARPGASAVVRRVVGGFFLCSAGVHLGIVAADAQTYRGFADDALLALVRSGWSDVFMSAPELWGLAVFAGEALIGTLLLVGGRAARIGWVAAILFHLLLMLFGFGFWLWCVPALALLVPVAWLGWPSLGRPVGPGSSGGAG